MHVILLHSNYQNVSATLVAIFRVLRTRIQIELCWVEMTPHWKSHWFWSVDCADCIIAYQYGS